MSRDPRPPLLSSIDPLSMGQAETSEQQARPLGNLNQELRGRRIVLIKKREQPSLDHLQLHCVATPDSFPYEYGSVCCPVSPVLITATYLSIRQRAMPRYVRWSFCDEVLMDMEHL